MHFMLQGGWWGHVLTTFKISNLPCRRKVFISLNSSEKNYWKISYTTWIQSHCPLIIKETFEWEHLDGSVECFRGRLLKLYLAGSYNVRELKLSKTGFLDENTMFLVS